MMWFWLLLSWAIIFYLLNGKGKVEKILKTTTRSLVSAVNQSSALQDEIALLIVKLNREQNDFRKKVTELQNRVDLLAKYQDIEDAKEEARRIVAAARNESIEIVTSAKTTKAEAQQFAKFVKDEALRTSRERRENIERLLADANSQASKIIADAKTSAESTAGDAYRALKEVDALKETATAMKNVIEGYGDRYLKPTYSLLDELAELYSFDEAGKQLKMARDLTKLMVDAGRAADCEYVESQRKTIAVRFVIDAFNGKVDTILTRSKQNNYGTLEQQIRDAFALVNSNGAAFRNAKINDEYLNARLDELRWATAVMALKEKEREEQKAIRERIREEEQVRKEIERALKESAKEEEMLGKAMEKVRQQVAKANDEQRAVYEAQLEALEQKLAEAEARSQRALSMAQQTRAGHVYVISNIGSFGENVLKVGMTRRLEPNDRVRELGDASVPFAFDVHAMIWSEDAPALERSLHKEFVKAQVNKVNPRKEFFRIPVAQVRETLEKRGIETSWTLAAAAAEYRESLAIEARMASSAALEAEWIDKQADYQLEEEAGTLDAADTGKAYSGKEMHMNVEELAS